MSTENTPHRGKQKPSGGKPKPTQRKAVEPRLPSGFAAREAAVRLLAATLHDGRSLDETLTKDLAKSSMEPRDRALARL
ncbi:MAG: MFS transporter, partial [Alphaproteobacteria bacterium]